MTIVAAAGNKGDRVRGDCWVSLEAGTGGALDIELNSRVKILYGGAIFALARRILEFYGITGGRLRIEDTGALDFVLAARIEACIRRAGLGDRDFLPEMLPENGYRSTRRRMRLSRLYLPGNSPKMMVSAGVYHPHAVILDLEDSVALARKPEARILVRNALRQVDFLGAERMVRINQLPLGLDDLAQIVGHNVHVILVPKCESADTIRQVNEAIADCACADRQEIFLMPIIESSLGVHRAAEIAGAADNIVALTIGLEDYTADLGVRRTLAASESFYARSHLVNICKAFGLQAIDSVFSDVADMAALATNVASSKALGFEGMGVIHPRQIPVIHAGYAPDAAEIDRAKKIVIAFDEATARGQGVVSLGSKMIDPPVVERALHTIGQAVAMHILSPDWRSENG